MLFRRGSNDSLGTHKSEKETSNLWASNNVYLAYEARDSRIIQIILYSTYQKKVLVQMFRVPHRNGQRQITLFLSSIYLWCLLLFFVIICSLIFRALSILAFAPIFIWKKKLKWEFFFEKLEVWNFVFNLCLIRNI